MSRKIKVFIAGIIIPTGLTVLARTSPQGRSPGQGSTAKADTRAGGSGGAQDQPARPRPVIGTVTTVGVDQFQIKGTDGKTITVKMSGHTRFRDGQQEIHLEDIKPDDTVIVMGRTSGPDEMTAFAVRKRAAGQAARMQNGNRAFGRIVSIQGNEVKVENPFQGQQTVVEVTGQTKFSRKVGDGMMAVGQRKDGEFVAQRVFTGNLRGRGGQGPGIR